MEKSYHHPFITSPIKGFTIKAKKIWHSKATTFILKKKSSLNLTLISYKKQNLFIQKQRKVFFKLDELNFFFF